MSEVRERLAAALEQGDLEPVARWLDVANDRTSIPAENAALELGERLAITKWLMGELSEKRRACSEALGQRRRARTASSAYREVGSLSSKL